MCVRNFQTFSLLYRTVCTFTQNPELMINVVISRERGRGGLFKVEGAEVICTTRRHQPQSNSFTQKLDFLWSLCLWEKMVKTLTARRFKERSKSLSLFAVLICLLPTHREVRGQGLFDGGIKPDSRRHLRARQTRICTALWVLMFNKHVCMYIHTHTHTLLFTGAFKAVSGKADVGCDGVYTATA